MDFLELYRQLEPDAALEADSELYVNWQKELGLDDVKQLLSRRISRSKTPGCRLLTGHRGVGKTTELKRVAEILESGAAGRKLFVSYLPAERWIDINDPQPSDIVFSIVRNLIDDLAGRGRVGFARKKFQAFMQELVELVSEDVELQALKFSLPGPAGAGVELTAALREGAPRVRAQLRKLLDGRQTTLIDLINDVLRRAEKQLREADAGYDGILVIVDGLEKTPRKEVRPKISNHEDLFIHNAHNLKFLGCHSLYTVPIELAYSASRTNLVQEYSEPFLLPTVPVALREGGPRPEGVAALRSIVERRAEQAGGSVGDIFGSADDLERLIQLSGGHVRNLLISIVSALDRSDHLPLDRETIERTVRNQALDTAFGLRPAEWAVRRAVHKTKQEPDAERCAEYAADPEIWHQQLRGLLAFAYEEDGKRWYDWNPLLSETTEEDS